jgi:hypothetical protein
MFQHMANAFFRERGMWRVTPSIQETPTRLTFAFIDAEKAGFKISRECHDLGGSQSGFFAWQERLT